MAAAKKAYQVVGAVAVARVAGADRYLERGATLPDGTENRDHLVKTGLAKAVTLEADAGGDPASNSADTPASTENK